MPHRLTRRRILGLGGALAAASLMNPAQAAVVEAVYVARSGLAPEAYCIGALIASDAKAEAAALSNLRAELKYRRVLRAKSTDRRKAQYARRLLDRLVEGEGLSFRAILAPAGLGVTEQDVRRQLLEGLKAGPAPVFMTAQTARATSKRSMMLAQSLKSRLPVAGTVEFHHTKDDNLMQLAGLLAALVRLDQAGPTANINTALLDYLKQKLKAGRLDEATLGDHAKFRVSVYRA